MASRVVEVICSFMVAQRVRIPVSASALFYKNLQGALQSAYGPTRTAVRKSAAVRTSSRRDQLASDARASGRPDLLLIWDAEKIRVQLLSTQPAASSQQN